MKRDSDTGDKASTAPDAQTSDGEQPLAPWEWCLVLAAVFCLVVWFVAARILRNDIAIGSLVLGFVIGRIAAMATRDTGRNYTVWAASVTIVSLVTAYCIFGSVSYVGWALAIAGGDSLLAAQRRAAREALAIRDDDQRALFSRDEPPPLASTARSTRLLCDRCRQLVDASIIERLNGEMVCTSCRAA